MLPYCTYILYSLKDNQLYIGFTTNLPNRLEHHNAGYTKSTKHRRSLKLIFCEYYLSKKDALRRERYFKTISGKKALKLMLRESFKKILAPHIIG